MHESGSEEAESSDSLLLLRFFLFGALALALAGLYAVTYTQQSRFVNACGERFERVPDITVEEGRQWCSDYWDFDTIGCADLPAEKRERNSFCLRARA